MPVWTPTWGTRSPVFGLDDAVVLGVASLARRGLWRWVRRDNDSRLKLVVSRSKRRFPVWWRTVAIEFFETEEAAQKRQMEIVNDWSSGQFAARRPIGPLERRRLRLQ